MSSAETRIATLKSEFASLATWEDRYKLVIAKGKAMPDMEDSLKTEEAKVRGCQSQVWLHAKLEENGTVSFLGESDALLVKGLVAVLLSIYSGLTPQQILATSPEFVRELGFDSHLTPSRANGLIAMIKQIRNFATAFQYMQSRK